MFISTKQTHHIYEFIIHACKSNAEKHLEKKLNLKFYIQQAGIGKDNSYHALYNYLQVKAASIKLDQLNTNFF